MVKLYDLKEDEDKVYMVLEYMEGGPLRQRLVDLKPPHEGQKTLSEEEVHQIIATVADAMEYCHSIGIVHRDLKVAKTYGSQRTCSMKAMHMRNRSSRYQTSASLKLSRAQPTPFRPSVEALTM